MPGDSLTIAELEKLSNAARVSRPSVGSEQALSEEVSLLGALYGRMIFRAVQTVPIDQLSERQRRLIVRLRDGADPPAG